MLNLTRISTTANMPYRMFAVFVLIALAFACPQATAATYYVRTDGSDSNSGTGTSASLAWATVSYAGSVMTAGDTVYVMPDTYNEGVTLSIDGTSGNPIRFIADRDGSVFGTPGNVTISATSGNEAIDIFNDDYIEFYGFRLQGDNSSAFAVRWENSPGGLLRGCEIFNGGVAGVWCRAGSVLTITNCLIRNNLDDGIYVEDGDLTVQNTTVADNASDGIEQDAGTSTITNSIVYNNASDGLDLNGGTMTHTYNLVYGSGDNNWEGVSASTGEISVDPLFVSSTDFHITVISPARNAGTDLTGSVDDDLDGRVRPYDGAFDIGCYEEGPIGYYKFDETSGTTAADSSGLGNDGTYTNGTALGVAGPYPGDIATAADFDGMNDHVELGNLDVSGSQITIAAWIKADSFSGSASRILAKASGAALSENYWSLTAYDSGGNDFLAILLKTDSGGTQFISSSTAPLETGQWIHVAAVYNGSTVKLYKNGVEILSSTVTGDITSGPTVPVWIGGSPSNEKYFDGSIDDVRLYSRSLSGVEIAELYGLVGHWPMDEGTGTTVADATAFENDATISGATWTTTCAGNDALAFDGTNDTAATNSSFDPPETGAISVWLRSAGNPGARSRPFGVGGDWEMRQEPDGTLSFDLGGEGPDVGAGPDAFITTEGLSFEDRWYHIVAQFDATDDSFEVYINGELVNSGINGNDMVKQVANTLTFGTRTGNTEYWEGGMRDFRVYSRWLGASEISDLSGLAGYWKLDEISGTVAVDSSPNGNDGTYINGVVLNQTGNIDQAADFDGTDDYVSVPDDSSLQMDDVFSLSAWIRVDASTNIDQMILNKEGEYEIAISSTGEIKWGITNTDPGWSWHSTGHLVAIGKWTHVALTYDNGIVSTYANGVLVDTYNGSGTIGDNYTSLNELRLGGRSNNPAGKYFDGLLDDVRVFNRVMCPEEVFGQYRGGRPTGVRIIKWIEVR